LQDYTVQTVQLKVRGQRKLGAFFTNNRIDPRTPNLRKQPDRKASLVALFDLRTTLGR